MLCLYLGFFQIGNITGNWCITDYLKFAILKLHPDSKIFESDKKNIILYKPENNVQLKNILENNSYEILDFLENRIMLFLNNSKNLTIKQHELDLITGVGTSKKAKILEQRDKSAFISFSDFYVRTSIDLKKILKPILVRELTTRLDLFRLI